MAVDGESKCTACKQFNCQCGREETMARPKCTVYRQYCMTHDFVHGAEAEELRGGIEKLIEDDNEEHDGALFVSVRDLQRLLDRVNARDSLAFLEAGDRTRKGKKSAA